MKSLITGFFMGTAELLPGISGSTVALIFGAYDQFIDEIHKTISFMTEIKGVLKKEKRFSDWVLGARSIDIKFLTLLLIGMVIAFATLSGLILRMFEEYPSYMVAILLGLVFAALPIPLSQIKREKKEITVVIIVAILLFLLLGIKRDGQLEDISSIYLFFAGILGISGMVIPGLSGSFILLILGVYYFVISLVHQFFSFEIDMEWFIYMVSFGLGVIVGFVTTAKVLKIALDKHRSMVMAVITGLLIGSVRLLYPFIEGEIIDGEIELSEVPISMFSTNEVILIASLVISTSVIIGGINLSRARKGTFDG